MKEVITDLHDLQEVRDETSTFVIESPLPTVKASQRRLHQVFENLLINAVVHGVPREGHGTITLGVQDDPREHLVFVRDNGPGIPEQDQDVIFKLFQRRSNQTDGTGIGLALVQRIIQAHNGRIWVESVQGQGSTFWIALPKSDHQDHELVQDPRS